jgi:hypothetical protein
MSFWRADHQVAWHGLTEPPRALIHVLSDRELVDALLPEFVDIFTEPQGLLLARARAHHIHLLPGTPPVVVRPYHYPTRQKDKLERQCADMLERWHEPSKKYC